MRLSSHNQLREKPESFRLSVLFVLLGLIPGKKLNLSLDQSRSPRGTRRKATDPSFVLREDPCASTHRSSPDLLSTEFRIILDLLMVRVCARTRSKCDVFAETSKGVEKRRRKRKDVSPLSRDFLFETRENSSPLAGKERAGEIRTAKAGYTLPSGERCRRDELPLPETKFHSVRFPFPSSPRIFPTVHLSPILRLCHPDSPKLSVYFDSSRDSAQLYSSLGNLKKKERGEALQSSHGSNAL